MSPCDTASSCGFLNTIYEESWPLPEEEDFATLVRQSPIVHEKLRLLLTAAKDESVGPYTGQIERTSILVPWHALQEDVRDAEDSSSDGRCSTPVLFCPVDDCQSEDDRSTRVPSRDSDSPRQDEDNFRQRKQAKDRDRARESVPGPGALLAPGLQAKKPQLQTTLLLAGLEVDERSDKAQTTKKAMHGALPCVSSSSSLKSNRSSSSRRGVKQGVPDVGMEVQVIAAEGKLNGVVMLADKARGAQKFKVRTNDTGEILWVKADNLRLLSTR